jgi:hypothetical protein
MGVNSYFYTFALLIVLNWMVKKFFNAGADLGFGLGDSVLMNL